MGQRYNKGAEMDIPGQDGREGDTEYWLEIFGRDQPRTQTLNPENPFQTGTKTILENTS